ncbi:MAG: AmmeMemoRadiSam system protein B [Parcubacteria group bacterium]|jgi:hypothetical protein
MLNKKYLYIAIVLVGVIVGLLVIVLERLWAPTQKQTSLIEHSQKEKLLSSSNGIHVHGVPFEDQELFFKSVGNYPIQEKNNTVDVMGGIVPHHLLPSFIIADFFSRLSSQEINTIILVGPNHYERGGAHVITSHYAWETPLGVLESDNEIVSRLEEGKLANAEENIISLDHSMTAILPFIKYYLPDVKVAPLILSRKVDVQEIGTLAEALKKYLQTNKAVLVASVDFSHYLTNIEAKQKNEESLVAIEKRSYGEIFNFGNDHMDSPSSISLLLKTMDALGADKMSVLHDTNSGELFGNDRSQTTSYLSLLFAGGK